jgi:hypothetical protein
VADPFPANCANSLPPATVLIDDGSVDDVTTGLSLAGCPQTSQSNGGNFSWHPNFDTNLQPIGLVDLHQLGTGYGGHMLFTHLEDLWKTPPTSNGAAPPSGLISETNNIDNQVEIAAHRAGIQALDERYAFANHEVCAPGSPYVNNALSGAPESFHPNIAGYTKLVTDLADALADPALLVPPPPYKSPQDPRPGTPNAAVARQLLTLFPRAADIQRHRVRTQPVQPEQ